LLPLAATVARLTIKDRVPQIEVAVGEEGAALVFRVLAEPAPADLELLRSFGTEHGFDVYLQPGGPDSIVPLHPAEPALLNYRLAELDIDFRFRPTDFTQVNVEINRHMVERVLEILDPQPGDHVLDLFCGIGNFTLPLARRAGSVVGVEGSRESVERARMNAHHNGIGNAEFHVADLAGNTADLAWARLHYDKVLLDPSRAGAQEVLQQASLWRAARLVYVSCSPATLARDAGILVHQHGYRLVGAGVMDMFPHTAHVESIALFER
jgi:23S rRNA (uracil1939-C5)-methyltransferase